MICPVCADNSTYKATRAWIRSEGVIYKECANCASIYTLAKISPKTENDNAADRNTEEKMHKRWVRATEAFDSVPVSILDYGCGNQAFVNYLREYQDVVGIDLDTQLQLFHLEDSSVAIAFMVEVIEHLPNPGGILEQIGIKLMSGGVLYIETTFADQIKDPSTHSYVDPNIGHRTIISRKGLDSIAEAAGLELAKEVNRNVVILRKK